MDSYTQTLELRPTRRAYRRPPFETSTVSACTTARRMGPLTRQQLVALLWRVRALSFTFSVTYTKFSEEDPELPGAQVTESGVKECVRSVSDEEGTELLDKGAWIQDNTSDGLILFSQVNAGFNFYAGREVYQDENGKFWINFIGSAREDGSAWMIIERDGDSDTVTPPGILFTGTFTILGEDVDLFLAVDTVYPVYSIDSATCTLAPSGYHEFSTAAGDPVWDTTTGDLLTATPLG